MNTLSSALSSAFDALLLVSFGGPESRQDVLPFLDRVLEGKRVPVERKLAVAEHYYQFGGVSPINEQNRQLLSALRSELPRRGIPLPWYWGNRCWHPLLEDTLAQMQRDGVRRALALFTSAYSSYSGCRQYRERISQIRQQLGPAAPEILKVRAFFNHPGWLETWEIRIREALAAHQTAVNRHTCFLFTAHSIPVALARGSAYVAQLEEVAHLLAARFGVPRANWQLVYQSRSGPPSQPWLEPDVCEVIAQLGQECDPQQLVVVPIGFVSDHLEVIYDLDTEAATAAREAGIPMLRVPTPGCHPRFVSMVGELVAERLSATATRDTVGTLGAVPDQCPPDCCPAPRRQRPS